MCERNKKNRLKNKFPHRAGSIGFALICDKLKKSNENLEEPSDVQVFMVTRKGNGANLDEETTKIIAELEEMQKSEDSGIVNEKLNEAMGDEHPGRVRFHGRSVTKTGMKKLAYKEETRDEINKQKDIRKVEVREEMKEQLRHGLQLSMSRLQQCNPTMVVPQDLFDFLLD